MDQSEQYLKQAREANMSDEDIIFQLTSNGWSIQQVHKLLYGDSQSIKSSQSYQQASQNIQPSTQLQPQPQSQMTKTQPLSNTSSMASQQNPVQANTQPSQATPSPANVASEQQANKKSGFFKFLMVAGAFTIIGTGGGIGISYLYFNAQVAKYSEFLDGGTIGDTLMADDSEFGITEIDAEEGVEQPDQEDIDIDPESGRVESSTDESSDENQPPTQSRSSGGTSTSSSRSSSNGGSAPARTQSTPQTSCTQNDKIPGGVCDAIRSLEKNPSRNNPYLSELDLSGIPGEISIGSISESSWRAVGGGGTIDAVATTALGENAIRATLQQKNGNWKVTGIQML